MLQLFFVLASFWISLLMHEHSFSSSETRSLKLPAPCVGSSWPLPLFLGRSRFPMGFPEFSIFAETYNQLEIDVRSRSCSKKRTCTITRSGNLSFCAAWVLASNESFWQLMSLQPCYQRDQIYSPQEACIQCHLHICQSHSTTVWHC